MKHPIVMGIHWAHDSAVSICSTDGILCTIAEERITRIKHYYGFPCRAIQTAMKYCGLSSDDIDIIAFTSKSIFYKERANFISIDLSGKKTVVPVQSTSINPIKIIKKVLRDRKIIKYSMRKDNMIHWEEFSSRHYVNQRNFLKKMGLYNERIKYYYIEHHRAHASSAFRLSGINNTCIITMDGKGDNVSATIFRGYPDGRMELIRRSDAQDSLGLFYQAVTEAIGFIPVDGEYKTMGLAATCKKGKQKNPFADIMSVHDGTLKSKTKWTFRRFNAFNPTKRVPNPLSSVVQTDDFKRMLDRYSPDQLAFYAQDVCERVMLKYVQDAVKLTKCRSVVASGGVMLNVKANLLINEKLKLEHFFIFPDATDSGLATGAALEALYQEGYIKRPIKISTPYCGHDYSNPQIERALKMYAVKHNLKIHDITEDPFRFLSESLIDGKVIGTFQGRLEMGPRALGNRSVLADARRLEIKDRINLILKGREWFVPFAPILLEEDARRCWQGRIEYPYMTFAVKANSYAKKNVPGAVHVDGSMRPQVVNEHMNPWLYKLLNVFKENTGIGILINTSFNRHGLPIVASPEDALEHLVNDWVDGLSIGNYYVEKLNV